MPSKTTRRRRYVLGGKGYTNTPGATIWAPKDAQEGYTWFDWVTTGANVPDYKRRISYLKSATTTLEGERMQTFMSPGYYSYTLLDKPSQIKTETFRYGLMGFLPTFPTATSLSETKANNQAKVRFLKRVREVQSSFQSYVSLGEIRETLRMIRNPAKAIREGLDDYLSNAMKRTRSRRAVQGRLSNATKRKIVADTWLEHAFGWAPLFSDVRSGAETLARRQHELRRETVYVRAGGSDITQSNMQPPIAGVYGYLRTWGSWFVINDVTVKYYGVVKREIYNDYKIDAQLFGYDPRSFVPSLWELIPYSFLVDYFTNIGDIINAWSHHRTGIAWCNVGVKKQARLIGTITFDDKYARDSVAPDINKRFLGISRSDPKLELLATRVYRAAYEGSFVPTLEISLPDSSNKWINMTALLLSSKEARRSIASRG